MNRIKKHIEKRAVACLYNHEFINRGRINKKKKKIVFEPMFSIFFRQFANKKERLAIEILSRLGYTVWETNLVTWCQAKAYADAYKIPHTWGEVQDIIRSYKEFRIRPTRVKPFRDLMNEQPDPEEEQASNLPPLYTPPDPETQKPETNETA